MKNINHQNDNRRNDRRKKKKIALFIFLPLMVSSLVAIVLFFFVFNRPDYGVEIVDGGADAVAVTAASTFDGIFNPESIFDELYAPTGLAMLGGNLVVADTMCDRIQILDHSGMADHQRVGQPGRFSLSYSEAGAFIDGFRENAMFMKPAGVFVNQQDDIIVADTGNHAIRVIRGEFVITIAGNGTPGYVDGVETDARFNNPRGVVQCPQGYIYVADTLNHAIRRIDPSGMVSLYAGAPTQSGFADGSLTEARFFEPSGLYLTPEGILYVADSANHAIRRITPDGQVATVAGHPGEENIRQSIYFYGGFVDGNWQQARFNMPRDLVMLPSGELAVADSLNHAIRVVNPYNGDTRTLLGGGGDGMFHNSTENLRLTRPEGITTNGEYLFISDTINNRIVSAPLTDRVMAGRPSRYQMLADTGLTTDSRFAFRGDIRVFHQDTRLDMGRVQPWIRGDAIFVPIRPLLEALGANVHLDESTGLLSITIADTVTVLALDQDYFIMRGVMVTTLAELIRLFPYTFEWFPELSLITVYVPADLRGV